MSRRPKFYFSFHSPYSWMASKLLEERFPDAPELLEYVPFFFPDAVTLDAMADRGVEVHYTSMSKAKHLYILQDTKRLAERFGFEMTWPVDVDPWWVLPHHAWLAAKRTGDEHQLFWALLEARWHRGENITDPATVARVATSIGLDGDLLTAAPDDPDLRRQGVDALESAYFDDVFGVPYFKIGPHRFWGLDRFDDFAAALEQRLGLAGRAPRTPSRASTGLHRPVPLVPDLAADPAARIPAAVGDLVGSYDLDTPGGCG